MIITGSSGTVRVRGLPPGVTVEANAWRFNGDTVVRQLAEIYIAPVIRRGLTYGDEVASYRETDKCVGMHFYFPPDICKEHLDEEPRMLEFWARNHLPGTKPWTHFIYPHTKWELGVLVARYGGKVKIDAFPDVDLGDGIDLFCMGYVDGPLPAGPRRKRAPRIPEIEP